ncbi:12179_t:CDS:1, partial [Funneliformis geosporum]
YSYLFLRHKKTKCWINGESTKSISNYYRVNEESMLSHSLDDVVSTLGYNRIK